MTVATTPPRKPTAAHGQTSLARRLVPLLTVVAVVLLGALYFVARRPLLSIYDATIYVTGAKSLALGDGYRLLGYLAQPPITYYPPGYSLALAPLFKLQPDFPTNLSLLQLVNVVGFYALLALGAVVLRRCYHASPTDTALAVLLAASTPLAFILSTAVLSDTLYGVLTLGSLLLVQAGWERRGERGAGLLIGGALLAALAYYTRTAGVALVMALAIHGLLQARRAAPWRVALALVPALLVPPLLVWTSLNGSSSQVSQWVGGIPGISIGVNSLENLLIVVLANFVTGSDVLWAVAPVLVNDEIMPIIPGMAAARPLAWLVASALYAFVLWQSWRAWRRSGELVHLYLLLYLLMTLFMTWRSLGRYIWPVAPIVAWYLVVGLRDGWRCVGARLGARRLPLDALAVGVLLLAHGIWLGGAVSQVAATGWPGDAADRATYAAMQRTAEYLRGLDPPSAPLGTNHDGTVSWWYLYTGRRGVDAIARADDVDPFHVRRAAQGDPAEIVYFVYHRANGTPGRGAEDLPALLATLAARGASTEPLFCVEDRSLCVYDWRSRAGAP